MYVRDRLWCRHRLAHSPSGLFFAESGVTRLVCRQLLEGKLPYLNLSKQKFPGELHLQNPLIWISCTLLARFASASMQFCFIFAWHVYCSQCFRTASFGENCWDSQTSFIRTYWSRDMYLYGDTCDLEVDPSDLSILSNKSGPSLSNRMLHININQLPSL